VELDISVESLAEAEIEDRNESVSQAAAEPEEEIAEPPYGEYTAGNKIYTLKYDIGTINKVEAALGKSVYSLFPDKSDGVFMPKVADVCVAFSFGLIDENGAHAGRIIGEKITGAVLKLDGGYITMANDIVNCIGRDCPFLFPDGSLS
jgi:hypothetical protein